MILVLVPVTVASLVLGFYFLSKIVQDTSDSVTRMMGDVVREILSPRTEPVTVIHTEQEEMYEPAWASWPTE